MVDVRPARRLFEAASLMTGRRLALLALAVPARAEAVTAIRRAIDSVAARAVAFTPTVVTPLDAKLIGDRIFLFVLLADREGERMIRLLLEERPAHRASRSCGKGPSGRPGAPRGSSQG